MYEAGRSNTECLKISAGEYREKLLCVVGFDKLTGRPGKCLMEAVPPCMYR